MNHDFPELAPYLDEPKQLPSGGFGKQAFLRLRFERRPGRSILAASERKAPLLVQRALYCDEGMPGMPVVYIITNSGGILQGDRYIQDFSVGPGASAHLTTQAATKIHEMDANHATLLQTIELEDGAYFEYVPDTVIPFRRSRFLTSTRIRIAPTATLFYSEILLAGRLHYQGGEAFEFDLFSSTVSAERAPGESLFVEKFVIQPDRSKASAPAVMGDFKVFGNVILLTPRAHADAVFDQVIPEWDLKAGFAAGASRLPNDAGLIFKVVGRDTTVVRRKVRDFWKVARAEVTGATLPAAFSWS